MRQGVTVVDPASTWVQASVDLAPDVTLLPGTSLEGATSVAAGATIGPDTTLIDVEVGEGATVVRTHGSLSVIGAGANVGPYAYLRPGTTLGTGGKIGTFVETKNAQIGAGAKVPHLTYAGDTQIGDGANIGAGTIFANYDGLTKSASTVGRYSLRRQRLGAGRTRSPSPTARTWRRARRSPLTWGSGSWRSVAAGSATCPAGWPVSGRARRPRGRPRRRSTHGRSVRPHHQINRPRPRRCTTSTSPGRSRP